MSALLNESDIKYTFLPPIKNNKLKVSNNEPVYLENNFKRDKQFYEINLDKFSILTNQPKRVDDLKLNSFTHVRSKSWENNSPRSTKITKYKWNYEKMPGLKVLNKYETSVPKNVKENFSDKKKMMLFEQKNIIEHKLIESSLKALRTIELAAHSSETARKNKAKAESFKNSIDSKLNSNNRKADKWASIDPNDIQLKREIIDHIYAVENRSIRCFKQNNTDFLSHKVNDKFERMEKLAKSLETA
jgi:hypothetical protein